MTQIKANGRQSVWDIALQEYGDTAGIDQLMLDNPQLNFRDSIAAGTVIFIDETKIINTQVVNYYKSIGYKPATAVEVDDVPVGFSSGFSLGFK